MFKEAIKLINKSEKIYIVSHENPDGDAIGSSFALNFALKKLGEISNVIMPICSEDFKFLPNIDECVSKVSEEDNEYDLIICLDSSNSSRLACSQEDFEKAKTILVIDHHEIVKNYGDVNCVDPQIPATCELIYNLLTEMNIEIDKKTATYLYTGIMTDTGSFNYSNTKPSTLYIASKLLEKDIDFADICKRLNDTIKESKLKLIAKTIDNMEVYLDGKIRYSYIDKNTLNNLNITDEEAEGMVNYLRSVENTQVAIYVREKENGEQKVSMRSTELLDVAKIAIQFGGGGHSRAAGYTMQKSYEEEKIKLLNVVEEMLK